MKTVLLLLILSSSSADLTSQTSFPNPKLPEERDQLFPQLAQEPTRTIEYQWLSIENAGLTSFKIPSGYRAITHNAGARYVEGSGYDDVHILILSPEEYELWENDPSQGRSLGVRVNAVFDSELMWTADSAPDLSQINQNGHQIDIYRVGGAGQYIGVISNPNGRRNSVQVVVTDERYARVAEMIMNSFDYL